MADVTTNKKLVDLDLLKYYDTKAKAWTKAEDATNLTAAKSYTDTEIGKVNDAATALTERVTAVEGKASANETAIGVLNGDVNTAGSVKKTVADEVAKIVAGAPEDLDTLKEISDWISGHANDAAAMNSAIQGNSSAITALQTLIGSLPESVTATDVVGYIQEAVAAEKARAEGVEGGLNTRLQAVESAVGETGSIADAIATAKSEAIAAAKTYSDGLDTAMDARVDVLEADNTANKAAIESINNADTGILATAKAYTDAELDKKGTYSKPTDGISKSDLASTVQTSLDKADNALPLSGGTMTGTLIAVEDADVTVSQVRNIYATDTDLTAGTSELPTGTICLVYE